MHRCVCRDDVWVGGASADEHAQLTSASAPEQQIENGRSARCPRAVAVFEWYDRAAGSLLLAWRLAPLTEAALRHSCVQAHLHIRNSGDQNYLPHSERGDNPPPPEYELCGGGCSTSGSGSSMASHGIV